MEPETTQEKAPVTAPVTQAQNPFIIPGAILIGFAMIAGAIFFSGGFGGGTGIAPGVAKEQPQEVAEIEPIRPIDENDHIRGNPNAPIVIVEYSDYDCPFCKNYHETMNNVMADYGSTGQVAWVYRHFPLEQLHPNAAGIALAAECVADIAGNEGFWTFSDLVFGERTTNAPTNITKLADYAVEAGADKAAFESCVSEGKFIAEVTEDFQDGAKAGVRGTPHSLVQVGGQQIVINGAQPYANVKQTIEALLDQIENAS